MSDSAVAGAARRAIGAGSALNMFAGVFLALSLAGSLILMIVGLTSSCPAGLEVCSPSQEQTQPGLFAAGVSGALMASLFYFLLRTIAVRVELAGFVALSQVSAPGTEEDGWTDAPQQTLPAGGRRPDFHPEGCPVCGSRRIRSGTCQRCGADAVEFDSREGWYPDAKDGTQERFFDGTAWVPETRSAIRYTLDDWDRPEPQWLVDPDDPGRDRFWDGTAWTSQVMDAWGDDEEEMPLQPR